MKMKLPRFHNSDWKRRVGLVLILTLTLSLLLLGGWNGVNEAQAAVGFNVASESHTGTTISTSVASFTWTHAATGTPRGVLVYVFTRSATDMVTSVTYGGTAMTRVSGGSAVDTATEPGRVDTFFLGASVPLGSQSVVVNRTNNTTGMYATAVTVTAAYDTEPTGIVLLQENGTFTVQSVNDGSPGSSSLRFAGGYGGGTAALAAGTGSTATMSVIVATTCNMNLVRETTAGTGARNVGFNYTTSDDRAGVHLAVREMIPRLTIGEGTDPANANAPRSSTNNALDGFTMGMNSGSSTVSSLTVTGSANFTATNIPTNGVKVWRDAGTIGAWDGADTLISTASSAIAGNATTVTISPSEQITTATQNYLVTVDMTAGATLAQTFTGRVTAASGTGLGTPLYNDAASATLTVSAVQNLTVGNGTNPANNPNALAGTRDNAMDAFTLALSAGTGNVGTLTVTGSANFTAANISGIKIYRDNATVGTFNGADVLVPSTHSFTGNVATVNLVSAVTVTTAAVNYLVLVDFSMGGTDGSFTGTVTAVAGAGLSAVTYSDASSATLTTKHPSTIAACSGCHGDTAIYTDATTSTSRGTPNGAFVGDHDAHVVKLGTPCSTCHTAPGGTNYAHRDGNIQMASPIGASGSYSKASPISQVNNPITGTCSTISCHGANNPTPQWGVGTAGCVDCHAGSITRTMAAGTLANVVAEMQTAAGWSHARSNGYVATNAMCIVCHLEGDSSTQKTSVKHGDGNIDLRDPDGLTPEAAITRASDGGTFVFQKFATSYAASTRYTDGHLRDDIDNVITQKFCLKCHDGDGASNPGARVGGDATSPFKPFNTTIAGAGYVTPFSAGVTGGVVDVDRSFTTTNSSVHPVKGPRNKDFPTPARFVTGTPYTNFTRAGTSGTKTNGVVLNCFDCHNQPTELTDRTVVAHGSTAVNAFRGTIYAASPTLCSSCHVTAYAQNDMHGAGSAWNTANGEHASGDQAPCHNCHGQATAKPARPQPAEDYHGFNRLPGTGADALWPVGATESYRPYGFIRNMTYWGASAYHRPFRGTEAALQSGGAQCSATNQCDNGRNMSPVYSPGGSY